MALLREQSEKRTEKLAVAVTPSAADEIRAAAAKYGVSANAWCAMTLTHQATTVNRTADALLEAAQAQIREVFGQQQVLDLLLEVQREECGDGTP